MCPTSMEKPPSKPPSPSATAISSACSRLMAGIPTAPDIWAPISHTHSVIPAKAGISVSVQILDPASIFHFDRHCPACRAIHLAAALDRPDKPGGDDGVLRA